MPRRLSRTELFALRPNRGVRITKRAECSYAAVCGAHGCDWAYVARLRVICEEQARQHRGAHFRHERPL